MDYKMIAIDLDGTLLNDKKELNDINIEVLRKINSLGVEVVIATGRRYSSAKELVKPLNIDLVIMANNGNIIRNSWDDKILITKYLNRDDFYSLVEEGKKRGLYPITHVDHFEEGYDMMIELDLDDEKYSPYIESNLTGYKKIEDFLKYDKDKVLAVCYTGDNNMLKDFEDYIAKNYPNKYNSHIMSKLTVAGGLLEIMHPKGSKWLSLKDYAKDKGIKPKEIIAIGDDNNDIEMVKSAGLGIAMKNASDNLKAVCDITTDLTNNEGGVGYILKKIFNI